MAAHCQVLGLFDHFSEKSSAIWISTEFGIQFSMFEQYTITPLFVPSSVLNSRSNTKFS